MTTDTPASIIMDGITYVPQRPASDRAVIIVDRGWIFAEEGLDLHWQLGYEEGYRKGYKEGCLAAMQEMEMAYPALRSND